MAENKNIVIRLMADTASYETAMTRAGSTAKTVASGMENTGRKRALITSGLTNNKHTTKKNFRKIRILSYRCIPMRI